MENLALFFDALSDINRLRILSILRFGELCVCEIVSSLEMTQSKVSKHLKILKTTGILKVRREAQLIYYRINVDNIYWQKAGGTLEKLLVGELWPEDAQRLQQCLANRKEGPCCLGIIEQPEVKILQINQDTL